MWLLLPPEGEILNLLRGTVLRGVLSCFEVPGSLGGGKNSRRLVFFFKIFSGPRGGTCTMHGAPCTVYREKAMLHTV